MGVADPVSLGFAYVLLLRVDTVERHGCCCQDDFVLSANGIIPSLMNWIDAPFYTCKPFEKLHVDVRADLRYNLP